MDRRVKTIDRISYTVIGTLAVVAFIVTTCKHDTPQVNQDEFQPTSQYNPIEINQQSPEDNTNKGSVTHSTEPAYPDASEYSEELEYFDEHFDDYYDDPEDGITYPDDIFDYLQD
jgi:hypothetical protein